MKWELKTLEDDVRRVHGDRYADEIRGPLQAFAWKSDIAYYHACESERVIKEALASTDRIDEGDPDCFSTAKAILLAASPDPAGSHIVAAQFKAEAHIIGSAQALHSLCDLMSCIIYWALQLDITPKPPQVNKLNLHSIRRTLSPLAQYSTTAKLIDATISSSEFRYLAAYVNTTKHKSLVSSRLSASFEADNRSGMQIKEFSYTDTMGKTITYARKWSHDFLFTDNHTLRLRLVGVGNSLNNTLREC